MSTDFGADAVREFLMHAGERGLLPTATASALAVGCRTVFELLSAEEAADLRAVDLHAVADRFAEQRATDFSPGTIKEYVRRVHRAWELFAAWKADPAHFSTARRATVAQIRRSVLSVVGGDTADDAGSLPRKSSEHSAVLHESWRHTYDSTIPIRAGHLVTVANIPTDLTVEEAERLGSFVRLLAASS
jgi:hypothetical protein